VNVAGVVDYQSQSDIIKISALTMFCIVETMSEIADIFAFQLTVCMSLTINIFLPKVLYVAMIVNDIDDKYPAII